MSTNWNDDDDDTRDPSDGARAAGYGVLAAMFVLAVLLATAAMMAMGVQP